MCQVHSGSRWTVCQPLLNSVQKKVWPLDCYRGTLEKVTKEKLFKEKPNWVKVLSFRVSITGASFPLVV